MVGYGFWMSYHLRSFFIILKLLGTCNLGVKVGGFTSLSQKKSKGDTTKANLGYCCYQDMVSPMYDGSYVEGL